MELPKAKTSLLKTKTRHGRKASSTTAISHMNSAISTKECRDSTPGRIQPMTKRIKTRNDRYKRAVLNGSLQLLLKRLLEILIVLLVLLVLLTLLLSLLPLLVK